MKRKLVLWFVLMALGASIARAEDNNNNNNNKNGCQAAGMPSFEQLQAALKGALAGGNGGLNLNMWGTVVDRDGVVCAVAFTGNSRGDQWPGSRVISAQKANTANAFSLPGLAL